MLKRIVTRNPDILLLFCFALIILFFDIRPLIQCSTNTPQGAMYTAVRGHPGDYYQYVYMIAGGMDGRIPFHNAYTEEAVPDVVLQPFYSISGFLLQVATRNPIIAYQLLRIGNVILLWACVLVLIRRVFIRPGTRMMAMLLYFSSGSMWILQSLNPFAIEKLGLPYYPFPIIARFYFLPPHHMLVISAMIVTFLLYTKTGYSIWRMLSIGVLIVFVGFLNPYVLYALVAVLCADSVARAILLQQHWKYLIVRLVAIISIAIPVLGYHIFIESVVLHNYSASAMLFGDNAIPLQSYILSLGILFFIAIPAIALANWKHNTLRILIIWAFLPMFMYFLPYLHIPVSVYRLFQTHQYIPLSLLSAFAITVIASRLPYKDISAWLIIIVIFIYGSIPYAIESWNFIQITKRPDECTYLSKPLVSMFRFIRESTPRDSVILTDEALGAVLPTFTNAKVMVGHEGNNNMQYAQKLALVQSFYANALSRDEAASFIQTHHIMHAVFGFSTPQFISSSYADLFEPVYSDGTLTVAIVK